MKKRFYLLVFIFTLSSAQFSMAENQKEESAPLTDEDMEIIENLDFLLELEYLQEDLDFLKDLENIGEDDE